jgi:hypothetical protein
MFGMNDVWREAYVPEPTAEMVGGRDWCLQRYLENMHALTDRLLADHVRVLLLTPTPFDQYSTERRERNLPGADDALAICGGMVRGIGLAKGVGVLDLHAPLRRRCAAGEELISDDRVHPNDQGHAAMAELVTQALLPPGPADVPPTIYAASRALHEAELRLRTIAMFRTRATDRDGGQDDAAIERYIAQSEATEPNPWVREQRAVCRHLLPRRNDLLAEVADLRQQLARASRKQ